MDRNPGSNMKSKFGNAVSAVLLTALLSLVIAGQAASADAVSGKKLAIRLCSKCHSVEDNKTASDSAVPSFEDIANWSNSDRQKLLAFLDKPHPMPDMDLTPAEVQDLVDYIISLKN